MRCVARSACAIAWIFLFCPLNSKADVRATTFRFGTLASHVPTYTVYVDRPQKVAEVWPLIDEVTAEHGIVTSLHVPG